MAIAVKSRTCEGPFATQSDYAECQSLHRKYGTTYFFASQLFGKKARLRTHALYGFVRMPDEWVDNPTEPVESCRLRLAEYRQELSRGLSGHRPEIGALRAFCDVVKASGIPVEEPFRFLDAMEQDLSVTRYETYEELRSYMRGSASAVGVMMSYILCDPIRLECLRYAMALGEAMQMTNFLRDVGEDSARGRIYLPLEDLYRFCVTEDDLLAGRMSDRFIELMRFEINRTRELYRFASEGIGYLPHRAQKAVRLASVLYGRILSRIESGGYDVFRSRARTSRAEKMVVAVQVLTGLKV